MGPASPSETLWRQRLIPNLQERGLLRAPFRMRFGCRRFQADPAAARRMTQPCLTRPQELDPSLDDTVNCSLEPQFYDSRVGAVTVMEMKTLESQMRRHHVLKSLRLAMA